MVFDSPLANLNSGNAASSAVTGRITAGCATLRLGRPRPSRARPASLLCTHLGNSKALCMRRIPRTRRTRALPAPAPRARAHSRAEAAAS